MIVTTVLRLGELMVRFGEGYIRGGLILDGGCVLWFWLMIGVGGTLGLEVGEKVFRNK